MSSEVLAERSQRIVAVVCRLLLMAVLATGVVWNLRAAVADQLASTDRPAALRLAMRLDPANPVYPARLAWDVQAADPQTAESLLRRAVRLDRYDASSWIRLGLLQEEQGHRAQAESCLLHAASVDVTWLPAWSLANFYFRQQRWDAFWSWAQKAAQMVPDDVTPLLRLAWYVAPREAKIQERLRIRQPEGQRQLLWFLIAQDNAPGVAEWGNRALTTDPAVPAEDVLSACEWLIQQKRPDLALPLWEGLAVRHRIPFAAPEPGSIDAVTNGDFTRQPLSRGFDWRLTPPSGVYSSFNAVPPGLGFEFSGREPESFLLLSEIVPVVPERQYTLLIQGTSPDLPPGSGLELEAADAASGQILARTNGITGSSQQSQVDFRTPQGVRFLTLMLDYRREPGTMPLEGHFAIRKISLVAAPGAASAALSASRLN